MIFVSAISGFADVSDWTTFTNADDVRDFVIVNNTLWNATNGGLLTLDLDTFEFSKYTNIDGLKDILLSTVTVDKYNNIWVAMEDGTIQRFDPDSNTWDMISDYEGYTVNDLYAIGDSVFVGLNIGISLFDSYRWEVKETYKIGDVNNLTIVNNTIWAATSLGVKTANLDFPNLIAPSAWTTYTASHGLPDNNVMVVHGVGDVIYAGTENGLAAFQNGVWGNIAFADVEVKAICDWNDTVLLSTVSAIYYLNENIWTQLAGYSNITHLCSESNGHIWASQGDNGLYTYDGSNWTHHIPNGPSTNNFASLAVDKTGNLWTASASDGISMFNGTEWFNYSTRDGYLNSNDFRDLEVDNQNRVWAASYGGGVTVFTPNGDDTFDLTLFYTDHLSGSSGSPNYVPTHGVKLDDQGNMWILNYAAASNNPVAVVDSTFEHWQYFSVSDGIRAKDLVTMEFDQYGRKWFGSTSGGVYVLNDNNTPFDKSDDQLEGTLSSVDGLASNNITSLLMDLDYIMYIGTPEGLNTYFSGELSEYLDNRVVNSTINTIMLDGVNNKWVGTSGGLSMLHSDGFDTTHYVSETHPLVSDNVTSLAFNEDTGELFIGTTNGLSRFVTPYTRPQETLNLVKGYPNPFVLESAISRFYIDNLGRESQVRIFTAEGFFVTQLTDSQVMGSRAVWDGKNDRGEWVSSGVYLYQIITQDGDTSVGKVAVVHP